jgi:hypothetical protein
MELNFSQYKPNKALTRQNEHLFADNIMFTKTRYLCQNVEHLPFSLKTNNAR